MLLPNIYKRFYNVLLDIKENPETLQRYIHDLKVEMDAEDVSHVERLRQERDK